MLIELVMLQDVAGERVASESRDLSF